MEEEKQNTSDGGRLTPSEVEGEAMTPPRWREKLKADKFKILGGILGVLIFAGAVFGAYKLGQKQVQPGPSPTPTPLFSKVPPSVRTSEFDTLPIEVQRAAEEGLPKFLQVLASDEMALKSYGIKSFEEAQSATLGKVYLFYTIGLTQLANYSQGQKVSFLITPTQTWNFAVLVNNEPRVDLEVVWYESRWQAVGIGGGFSQEMTEVERRLSGLLREKGISTDCPFKPVRIFSLNAVFVLLDCVDKEFIIPLTPTGWFDLEKNKLYPAEEVMLNFAEEAKRTLKEPPELFR